ncbi:MAG: 30S ribosome-binding factor RbfA [Candidatus Pacebacteria bacterium]|nr:30S ribosome-binding factor RbfA [Candidatus Paceibacterota bacterium]
MSKFRDLRVSSLIREELGKIMLKELEFDGALVTITEVDVSEDLENATVNVSVIPSEKAEKVLEVLGKFRSRLQFLLQRKIEIKPMPHIVFRIDHGLEKAAELEKVFLEVEKEEKSK